MAEAKLTPEQWAEIRLDYRHDEKTSSIARRHNVHPNTITNRRKRDERKGDPWPIPESSVSDAINGSVESNVIDMTTRHVIDQPVASGSIEDLRQESASELMGLYELARQATAAMCDLFDGIKAKRYLPAQKLGQQSQSQFLDDALSALAKLTTQIRNIHGLLPGVATISSGKNDGPADIVELRIVYANKDTEGQADGSGLKE